MLRLAVIGIGIGCIAVAGAVAMRRAPQAVALVFAQQDAHGRRTIAYYDPISKLTVHLPDAGASAGIAWGETDSLQAARRSRIVTPRSTRTGMDLFLITGGAAAVQITRIEDFPPPNNHALKNQRNNVLPQWSPDEDWIAFVSVDPLAVMDVYLIRPDGSDLRLVAHNLGTATPLIGWVVLE